ncbi:MAG: hypothetical protein NWF05_11965 [Candidatus Bathyarchaeota archaeon]|nr:hypothetical protein [Candidatus Bathyarchaeota archaeon]
MFVMTLKHGFAAVLLVALMLTAPVAVFAQATVGVKVGDYAEYNVSFTGTPMEGHDANWAKMTVDAVEGGQVNVTFSSLLADGTVENATEYLNFDTGRYIDYFVVPAGLQLGDSFYDSFLGNNVSIYKVEVKNYAGADRTIVTGDTPETVWQWDQATGVLVEADSTYPDFTLHTVIDTTNLWAPQPKILGLDPLIFYALIAAIAAAIAIIAVAVVLRKKAASKGSP